MPDFYRASEYVVSGGLMSYGENLHQKLTGQSLRDCPLCGNGHMLVIDTFPVASLSRTRPPNTS